ncbi:hypothetical protein V6Z12_D09G177000 [Gossypium hirsutum]
MNGYGRPFPNPSAVQLNSQPNSSETQKPTNSAHQIQNVVPRYPLVASSKLLLAFLGIV